MKAAEYLAAAAEPCTFWVWEKTGPDGAKTPDGHPCGKPAIGVYVTADDRHEGRYVCAEHAKEAEHGDGPVFLAD